MAETSRRKCLLLLFLLFIFIGIYNGVEARGGRGGGRGGSSRGSSRGGSRSRSGSSSSSRVRSAISRYRGPKYKSSNWKLGLAAGTVWGLSSYKRRSRYRKHPDREPQVCFNAVNPRNGTYGYFICPEEGQPDSYDYCCGEEGEQRCCGFFDDGGRVAGVVIGVLAFCVAVGVGIYCICTRCVKKRSGGGGIVKDSAATTWNKSSEHAPLNSYPANDSVTLPSTTEHMVQPSPVGYTSANGLPYSTNPAQMGYVPDGAPPTQYPPQPYGGPPIHYTDGYSKDPLPPGESGNLPYSTDPYSSGQGVGFTYSDPSAPPGSQGYAPVGGQPYPPAPPPPYPQN